MPVTPKSGSRYTMKFLHYLGLFIILTYGMFKFVGVRVQTYADIVIFGATAPRPFIDLSPEKDAED